MLSYPNNHFRKLSENSFKEIKIESATLLLKSVLNFFNSVHSHYAETNIFFSVTERTLNKVTLLCARL